MTRPDDEIGPGVRWLAERCGCSPEDLVSDPRRLTHVAATAGAALADLAARLGSKDPDVRADAEREIASLREQMEAAPTPGDQFRSRVARALRETAERLKPDEL